MFVLMKNLFQKRIRTGKICAYFTDRWNEKKRVASTYITFFEAQLTNDWIIYKNSYAIAGDDSLLFNLLQFKLIYNYSIFRPKFTTWILFPRCLVMEQNASVPINVMVWSVYFLSVLALD